MKQETMVLHVPERQGMEGFRINIFGDGFDVGFTKDLLRRDMLTEMGRRGIGPADIDSFNQVAQAMRVKYGVDDGVKIGSYTLMSVRVMMSIPHDLSIFQLTINPENIARKVESEMKGDNAQAMSREEKIAHLNRALRSLWIHEREHFFQRTFKYPADKLAEIDSRSVLNRQKTILISAFLGILPVMASTIVTKGRVDADTYLIYVLSLLWARNINALLKFEFYHSSPLEVEARAAADKADEANFPFTIEPSLF